MDHPRKPRFPLLIGLFEIFLADRARCSSFVPFLFALWNTHTHSQEGQRVNHQKIKKNSPRNPSGWAEACGPCQCVAYSKEGNNITQYKKQTINPYLEPAGPRNEGRSCWISNSSPFLFHSISQHSFEFRLFFSFSSFFLFLTTYYTQKKEKNSFTASLPQPSLTSNIATVPRKRFGKRN